MIEESTLIREYVLSLRQKSASVFLGSGMSLSVFKKDWGKLIRPYAKRIGLKGKILNYPFAAQAYVNAGHDELQFKSSIANNFKSAKITPFHDLIAKLPIHNYWTTNYDTLIENALNANKKHYDVMYNNDSFCVLDDQRDRIVYKCHGDCNDPQSIIITKSDYEKFRFNSFNFTHALYNELASSTILFLGYSFNDPDINNIIETLSVINETHSTHFFITKKETGNDECSQQHWVDNIKRYGIETLLIDDYNYIDIIMEKIAKQYMAYKILISGSAVDYKQFLPTADSENFLNRLGYELVKYDCSESNTGHGLTIVNGNGKGVGPFLYEGIAEAAASFGLDMADYLIMYPFPKIYYEQFEKELTLEEKYHAYRENMISKCGIVFFIFGNKYNPDNEIVNADGVRKEFDIAVKQGKYVFPIGATGYMAKELANEVLSNFEKYNGDMPNIKVILQELNDYAITPQKIIEKIIQIIDILAFRPELM